MFLAWPDDDQEKAIAWLLEQRSRCPGCHLPWDLVTDPEHAKRWRVVQDRCHACEARGAHQSLLRQTGQSLDGLFVSVEVEP